MATTRCILVCAVLFTVCCIQVHCRAVQQADNSTLYFHGNLLDKDLLTEDDLDKYQPNEAYDEHDVGVPSNRNKHKKEHINHLKPKHENKHKYKHGRQHGRQHDRQHGHQHGRQHGHQHDRQHGRQHGHQHGHQHGRQDKPPLFEFHWWDSFVNTLVEKCKLQRIDRQFAILYLDNIPLEPSASYHPRFEPHDEDGDPILEPGFASSPPENTYNNYIVARPTPKKKSPLVHAEETLLNERIHLWDAYTAQNPHKPNIIILYSWFMPCPVCTDLIIDKLGEHRFKDVDYKVVAYTSEGKNSNVRNLTPEENKKSREKLENKNFLVYRDRNTHPRPDTTGADVDPIYRMDSNMTSLMLDQMSSYLRRKEPRLVLRITGYEKRTR